MLVDSNTQNSQGYLVQLALGKGPQVCEAGRSQDFWSPGVVVQSKT